MTPFIVWEVPNYAPLAIVFIHDTYGLKPKERIVVRNKETLKACIRLQRKAKRDGERFQYEIRRRKRLVMAPLKAIDMANNEPTTPTGSSVRQTDIDRTLQHPPHWCVPDIEQPKPADGKLFQLELFKNVK